MPTRHKYIMIIGKDDPLIQDIMLLFHDQFRPFVEIDIKSTVNHIQEYHEQMAAIIIDDSVGNQKVIDFIKVCHIDRLDMKIPIFLLDSHTDNELSNQAYFLGVNEVIRKPYNQKILKQCVLNLTDLYKHKYRLEWLIDTQTSELKESLHVLNHMQLEVLESLGTLVEFRSFESGEHIYRVRVITELLMNELQKKHPEYGISNEMITEICLASILHDIGKISISDTILNKPSKLTEKEFESMKLHTEYGCDIIKHFKGLYTEDTYPFYYDIIRYHHEKWDGGGYPDGLKGDDIPIWSQIVSVADIYDALTNKRVYKPPYDHNVAMAMIFNGECGVINPVVLECLSNIEDQIKESSQQELNKEGSKVSVAKADDRNLILHNLEKERAYHRAYCELLPSYYFEYDSEYRTIQYFNMLNHHKSEKYKTDVFENVHPDDRQTLQVAIQNVTADNPIVSVQVRLFNEFGEDNESLCHVTIRTTWDIYTNKQIGGVGKIEVLNSSEN